MKKLLFIVPSAIAALVGGVFGVRALVKHNRKARLTANDANPDSKAK